MLRILGYEIGFKLDHVQTLALHINCIDLSNNSYVHLE